MRVWWFEYFTLSTCWRNFPVKLSVSLCFPQYPSLPPSFSLNLSPFLSLSLSLSLSLACYLSLSLSFSRSLSLALPPPLSLCLPVSLSLSFLALSLSLSLCLRLISLFFHAPTNSLSITGGWPVRLESACMSLLTNLKPVFIARSILLYVSTYFLCQSKYFLTFFLSFWIVRDSFSLSFCACYPG